MKRVLLFLITTLSSLVITIFFISSRKDTDLHFLNHSARDEDDDEEHDDGTQKALWQEFLMTRDPSLDVVPTQRMIEARRRMEEINASLARTANTNGGGSLNWQERGPNNVGGRTRAILIDKSDATGNTVWAGGVSGGLWKTTNFKTGAGWTKVNDFFDNLVISCIGQDPSNPQNIYFGTGEGWFNIDATQGLGIWKYNGTTWTQLASTVNSTFYYVEKIVVNSAGAVFAATRNGGLQRSSDGGGSWTTVLSNGINGGTTSRAADIEIASDGNIYCSLGIFSIGGIFRTADNGTTWTKIYTSASDEERIELSVAPSNANVIYALIHGANGVDLVAGTADDDGIKKIISTANAAGATPTWTTLTTPSWCDAGTASTDFTRNQAWYDLIAAVDPNNSNIIYIGGVDVLKSTNGGTTWSQVTQWAAGCAALPSIHADIHSIQFFGASSTEMVIGCDGGIFYTTNGGTSFTAKNSGYDVTQYYGVAMAPAAGSNTMLAGAQDNGSHLFSTSGINSVISVSGGDGGFCFIDQTNANIWITAFPGSTFNLFRSGSYIGSTSDNNARFIDPAAYDDTLNVLYYGSDIGKYGFLKNAETGTPGTSVKNISAAMGTRQVSAVKVDPNNAATIWLGCSVPQSGGSVAPNLVKVTNANATTPTATAFAGPTLPAKSYISSIDIERGNSNHMLVTVSNYGVASVWESTDGATTWTSLDNNGVNLPDMPVRWGIFIPGGYTARLSSTATASVKGILIATELGVWVATTTNGTSTTWVADNTGLANVRVDQLVLRSSDKEIAAATHGRGIFTTLLLTPPLPVVLMNFDGQLQSDNVLLRWTTSSEFNSSYFELEKSFDGTNFRDLSRVTAAGYSNSVQQYNYLDNEPPSEFNYYRLKMVDANGKVLNSDVKLIRNGGIGQQVYILGNPFGDNLAIRFAKPPQTDVKIRMITPDGKTVFVSEYKQLDQSQIVVNTSKLNKGNYILQTIIDGHSFTNQVVK